jgi:hypothetical protein
MAANKIKKVCFIRHINGDDLIAEVIKNTTSGITVRNPMMIVSSVEMEKGKQTLVMFPWIPQGIAVGNLANIRPESVVLFNEAEPEIKGYYEEMCLDAFVPKKISTVTPEQQKNLDKNVISFQDRKQLLLESVKE